ncbi:MAG: polysaccharide lyase, partial [bacterium]
MGKTEFLMGRKDKILFNLGLIPSQGSIIETANGKILKVVYPFGRFGPLPGSQWKVKFQDTEIVCLSYKLYIPDDFDFMKGGKLPGLGGGKGNTGGDVPNGFDGWS